MDEERKQLLLSVLQRGIGKDNPSTQKFLDLAVAIRDMLETGSANELQFLHGMLDGALAQLPGFLQKRLDQDKASGK